MKKYWTVIIGLILLLGIAGCGSRWTRDQSRQTGPSMKGVVQNQPSSNQSTVQQPSANNAIDPLVNTTDQSLNNLDQSLGTTDTLNDEADGAQQTDPQIDQGISSLDSSLNDLQNSVAAAAAAASLENVK